MEEIESMSEKELNNLVKLADNIEENLYWSDKMSQITDKLTKNNNGKKIVLETVKDLDS
jgi:hypothetical protein